MAISRGRVTISGGGVWLGATITGPDRGGRATRRPLHPRPREYRSLLRARRFAGSTPRGRTHTPAFVTLAVLGITALLAVGLFGSLASAGERDLTFAMSTLPGLPAASASPDGHTVLASDAAGERDRPPASSRPGTPEATATASVAAGASDTALPAWVTAALAAPPPESSTDEVAPDTSRASTPAAAASEMPTSGQRQTALEDKPSAASPPLYHTYAVQPGDTVSGIAASFGVRIQDVINNNAGVISEGSLLVVGATLQIPAAPGILHNIRVGENLADIADAYGVTLSDILSFPGNRIDDPSTVLEGMQILVLNGTPPAPEVAADHPVAEPDEADVPEEAATPAPTPEPTPTQPPEPVYQFIWPLYGNITSYFGPSHPKGIDISVAFQPVVASASGKVVFVGGDPCCSYGYYVDIQHADGYLTRYAHLSRFMVTLGQTVGQGETIGISGNTGYSTGAHLHFEIRRNGIVRNPLDLLP
ncbi:MAG: peptidoglycan DD-metalloendopeptidase family protein [Dehalococcoidia bacterium]